jgi:hypothetical protein
MKYNRFILMSCLVLFIVTSSSYCQQAENAYKSYSKFGFFIQPAFVDGFYLRNTQPALRFNKTFSYQAGVVYSFTQAGNFNFKAGLAVKTLRSNFDVLYTSPTSGKDYSKEWSDVNLSTDLVFSEMIKAEYFFNVSPVINIVFGFGANIDLRLVNQNEMVSVNDYDIDSGSSQTILVIYSKSQQLTASADLSVGANFKTGYGMFQFDVFVNTQLANYPKDGMYTFYDNNNIITQGTYIVKGNYYGATMTFSPKRKLKE